MLLEVGEKLHVIYRALFENSTRRHFVGEVITVDRDVCRLQGYAFIYDTKDDAFLRKTDKRITFIDVGSSGHIVNLIPANTDIDKVHYRYERDTGLTATDGGDFELDISEFSFKT